VINPEYPSEDNKHSLSDYIVVQTHQQSIHRDKLYLWLTLSSICIILPSKVSFRPTFSLFLPFHQVFFEICSFCLLTLEMFKLLQITAVLLGNALISFICFNFLHEKLHTTTLTAVAVTVAIAILLTVLIALSDDAKCVVLLMLPQLCSKRGRAGLIAFAVLLTLNGPFKNTCSNIKDLSRSISCGQVS
jgi:4-amino-4-deoxy-L-arabinose transferase-like glycosyltransferase